MSPDTLRRALARAPRLIAADGGADVALAAGLVPDLVVGDLDSISGVARAAFRDRLRHIPDQDSTDFAKALRTSPASLTIAVGFIGARADHFLACLSTLARAARPCLLLGEEDCVFMAPRHLDVDVPPGTRVSLWPMGPVTGRGTGLRWPVDGIAMAPDGRVGTSNEATGPVSVTLDGAAMAVILPAAMLDAAIAALTAPPRGSAPDRL